jgi:integrase
LVRDFGPLALKAIQQQMVEAGLSRSGINGRVAKIKRIFRWAASEQLAPPSLLVGLQTVMGLQKGRTSGRETRPVMPISDEVVEKTLPYLPEVVADMVRFQRFTGCRPGEACTLRPRDVDRSGETWRYVPASHKMEHRDRQRIIFIGPKAKAVLAPYLLRDADTFCFSPEDTDRKRKAKLRAKRKTPVQPSQADRSQPNPKRKPGKRYNKRSYGCAIHRACKKAGVECWGPNRLRHTAASEIRSRYGLEAAQVILGHAKADVTQVYAEWDQALAAEIMGKIG